MITFVVTMLADHPDILARLRKEILDALGPNGRINHENVRGMKYLRAVLNGKHSLTSSPQPILTCLRNSEIVPESVRIDIPPNLTTSLRQWLQSVEYQMYQKECYLASARWGRADLYSRRYPDPLSALVNAETKGPLGSRWLVPIRDNFVLPDSLMIRTLDSGRVRS